MPMPEPVRDAAVLFDLDGTFADTAADMAAALNRLRAAHGRAPLPLAEIRPFVSHGGRGMLEVGFGLRPGDSDYESVRHAFLACYAEDLVRDTAPFPGMAELVATLEARAIPWGIVTNKPGYLTRPLLEGIGYAERAACVVCGDTTPTPKPHPRPLLHACELLGVDPERCWYLGDAERDIQAGRAAGMGTLIALFGYLGAHDDPSGWDAHGAIDHPLALLDWLPGTPA
ncbi:HAD family hydrolase [Marichromatium bheemlicum]|uniref:HAD-IA family hydrolase n=1 Tax=Marichromatium bheemlicum TaxID=365339 RepID=A0ABX1I786_9GAMM|nr:HAD-IA family hydrolase [Marichromatium bheemlicum]NKN33440.1 HAD-IA family hydrolase [Marichromatium bheemlicum]